MIAMGMFDEIRMEYPVPDSEVQDHWFQTKDFHCIMDRYTVSKDGRLIHHKVRYERATEQSDADKSSSERDKKPIWEWPSLVEVPLGDEDINYHGDIRIITCLESDDSDDRISYQYLVRFTEGIVQWVKRL